ncbi:DUF4185 domain-containing protein [Nocardia brevicatena]|uniref:DUF4185 domain-containing protein n=1 Tax=Nocardia brevicatena TaxID=37327 RepID=UPI0012F87786|nr:DUF4185 domain-containing protein [Nocardia brevicatena]
MAAVFKSEYDNFSYTLRGNANLFGEMDHQGGRAMVDGRGVTNNSFIESGPRLRMVSSTPHHDLNTLLSKYAYTDDGGWTGADSTYMRRLPDDRHVFMFSDTFLGRVEANGSRARDTPFVSNSFVVIERDGTMRTALGATPDGQTRAVLPPRGNQFHWLGGSHVTSRDTLDVMFLGFTGDARVVDTGGDFDAERLRMALIPGGGGELDFQENLLARFDAHDLRQLDVTPMPSETGVHWASWVEFDQRDNHTYVYGVQDEGAEKFMHVARVGGDDLRTPWQFFDGEGGWSPHETDSAPLMSGVANEYSVSRLNDNNFLLVTQDTTVPYSPDIVGYLSDSPTGPFGPPTLLYRATESGPLGFYGDPETVVYNAHEQPDLRRGNELTLTYNLNASVEGVLDTTSKYRPQAVKVRFDIEE